MAFFKPIITSNKNNIVKRIGQFIFDKTEKQIYIDINDEIREELKARINNQDAKIYVDDSISQLNTTLSQSIENLKPIYKSITLVTSDWSLVSGKYRYNIIDSNIDSNTLVTGYLDIDNQSKMFDGYIDSYDGGYYIYTSVMPSSSITMKVIIQKGVKST